LPSCAAWPEAENTHLPQTRLHFRAGTPLARRLYDRLELAFEDDGIPLAIVAVGEDERVQEVSVYADGDTGEVERRIRETLGGDGKDLEIAREALDDIDWVAKSLEGLQPVRAGRFLVHGAHDRARRRIGDIAIEIEAGLAFGTGHHGTTAGCLETIARVARREGPRNALDLGTGSAVLAIALAKLARIPVLATDIDPVATGVARTTVRLNGMEAFVRTQTAPGFHHPVFSQKGPFDLIVANILARPLMRLAPDMASHVSPNGSLILSGILERQRNAVLAAYVGQSFRHVRTLHMDGWVTLWLKR
jgi:ribosomal protein L11 methyltransferase